mmetsp:Transcript_148695/g.277123  ORF Transcript_148695/g.277123 Transcript_148695/m.277123 type:complete len:200 (-) Transcript_148695:1580-2179(-)
MFHFQVRLRSIAALQSRSLSVRVCAPPGFLSAAGRFHPLNHVVSPTLHFLRRPLKGHHRNRQGVMISKVPARLYLLCEWRPQCQHRRRQHFEQLLLRCARALPVQSARARHLQCAHVHPLKSAGARQLRNRSCSSPDRRARRASLEKLRQCCHQRLSHCQSSLACEHCRTRLSCRQLWVPGVQCPAVSGTASATVPTTV